jgi:septal ring-binding cell division protein DamX
LAIRSAGPVVVALRVLLSSLANLVGVRLLQRGEALIGTWDAECRGFVQPTNQSELTNKALASVLESHPDAGSPSSVARVFTCPRPMVARFRWR